MTAYCFPRIAPLVGMAVMVVGLCGRTATLEAQQPHWLGFRGDLGAEVPKGNAAVLFQGNIRGEFSLLFQPKPFQPFYFGFGASWTTFHMQEPWTGVCIDPPPPEAPVALVACEPWNNIGSHFLVGVYLGQWLPLPFYLEGRLIERRLRPMDRRFWAINSNNYIKDTPFPEYTGLGFEGVVGVQLPLTGHSTSVDVAVRMGQFKPVDVAFDDIFANLPDLSGGWTLGLQLGLVWFP